ncbi:MAG: hypothetical protein RIQ98_370, partial [Bacteroidota bacterium]
MKPQHRPKTWIIALGCLCVFALATS